MIDINRSIRLQKFLSEHRTQWNTLNYIFKILRYQELRILSSSMNEKTYKVPLEEFSKQFRCSTSSGTDNMQFIHVII